MHLSAHGSDCRDPDLPHGKDLLCQKYKLSRLLTVFLSK